MWWRSPSLLDVAAHTNYELKFMNLKSPKAIQFNPFHLRPLGTYANNGRFIAKKERWLSEIWMEIRGFGIIIIFTFCSFVWPLNASLQFKHQGNYALMRRMYSKFVRGIMISPQIFIYSFSAIFYRNGIKLPSVGGCIKCCSWKLISTKICKLLFLKKLSPSLKHYWGITKTFHNFPIFYLREQIFC